MLADHELPDPPGERIGALSAENRERLLATLRDHQDYAAYAGVRLLAYGRSHEFADRSQVATAKTKAIHDGTKAAVDRFFSERGGPLDQLGRDVDEPAIGTIRIGIGRGWIYEPWRGAFYPEGLAHKRELEFASRRLTAIEINGTFYRTPGAETFARWHDETPDGFVFALKAPRYATTRRELATAGELIERFCTGGPLALKDKLGPINWQLAPTKKLDLDDLARSWHCCRNRSRAGRCATPSRSATRASATLRSSHSPASTELPSWSRATPSIPHIDEPTAPFVYARIMGTSEGEPAGYSAVDLDRWAGWARERAGGAAPRDVFLFVIGGHKVANPAAAQALIERVG